MNDFDYDAMQKKRIARGAQHKRCGSKSKNCSLPSDNLTPAQMRALNGEVKQYNLNEPMTWEAFKAMPQDLQVQYVKGLNSRFGVGMKAVGEELFLQSGNIVRYHFKRHGVKCDVVGSRRSREMRRIWEAWLGRKAQDVPEEPWQMDSESPNVDEPVEQVEPAEDVERDFGMAAFTAEWCGEFDAAAFMVQLSKLPIPGGRVRIRLEVVKE